MKLSRDSEINGPDGPVLIPLSETFELKTKFSVL